MDIPLPSPTAHQEGRYHVFMQVAMMLSVITGVEIVVIFLPMPDFSQMATLVVLSLVKFVAVIAYFMHLRWDKLFCSVLFGIGLALGGGTVMSFLLLFAEDRTETSARAQEAATPAGQPGQPAAANP